MVVSGKFIIPAQLDESDILEGHSQSDRQCQVEKTRRVLQHRAVGGSDGCMSTGMGMGEWMGRESCAR